MGFDQDSTQASHWKGHFKLLALKEAYPAIAGQLFPGLRSLIPPKLPPDVTMTASMIEKATDVAFLALSQAGTVVLLHHGHFDADVASSNSEGGSDEAYKKLWFLVGLDRCMDAYSVNPEEFQAVACDTPSMAALKAANSPEDLKALDVPEECLLLSTTTGPAAGVASTQTMAAPLACSSVIAIPAFLVDAWETAAVSRTPEEVAFQTLQMIREFDKLQAAMSVTGASSPETCQQHHEENLADKYLGYIPAFLWACAAGKVMPLELYPTNHLPSCQAWVKNVHDAYFTTTSISSAPSTMLTTLKIAPEDDHIMDAKVWVEDDEPSSSSKSLSVHSLIPRGLAIGCGAFGRCVISQRFFKAGTLMYRAYCQLTDTANTQERHQYNLHVHDYDTKDLVSKFVLDDNNSVVDGVQQGCRQLYGFDGFMNHSCDPNTCTVTVFRTMEMVCYDTIALRDVHAGDEITCDYACFDYECNGHEIPVCQCGAPTCRGSMKGFMHLKLDEQVRILHLCDEDIIEALCKQKNLMFLNPSQVPSGVKLMEGKGGDFFIVADRMFEKGDLVFENKSQIIPKDTLTEETRMILQVRWGSMQWERRYFLLDKDRHVAKRDDYYESFGFDTFMDHSCDPNTDMQYRGVNSYSILATRTISPGEKLTCDYEQLDNQANGQISLPTTRFHCYCGAERCRGLMFC